MLAAGSSGGLNGCGTSSLGYACFQQVRVLAIQAAQACSEACDAAVAQAGLYGSAELRGPAAPQLSEACP